MSPRWNCYRTAVERESNHSRITVVIKPQLVVGEDRAATATLAPPTSFDLSTSRRSSRCSRRRTSTASRSVFGRRTYGPRTALVGRQEGRRAAHSRRPWTRLTDTSRRQAVRYCEPISPAMAANLASVARHVVRCKAKFNAGAARRTTGCIASIGLRPSAGRRRFRRGDANSIRGEMLPDGRGMKRDGV